MRKFRKKPVVIEAVRIPAEGGEFSQEEFAWLLKCSEKTGEIQKVESQMDGSLVIHTLEGAMEGRPGDYIIRGVNGELYPCKPDIFKKTYEEVTE